MRLKKLQLLIALCLLSTFGTVYGQSHSVDLGDSIKYSAYEDSLSIDCLLKQKEKDTIIASRGRRVESLLRVAVIDSSTISNLGIENGILQKDNDDMNIKLKKTPKKLLIVGVLGFIFGVLIP